MTYVASDGAGSGFLYDMTAGDGRGLHYDDPEWMRIHGELEVEAYLSDPAVVASARSFGYDDVRAYGKAHLGFKGDGLDGARLNLVRIRESQARSARFLEEHTSRASVLATAGEINKQLGLKHTRDQLEANLPEDLT